ncbi:type II toxin-antitoxin system RelE/ParE family toxin [Candidatus Woesearchaeota archaeon]|nr:type II toxin-antitoxin system RelE/ParE family toxin [Candidatus Woesearchaeota archaeon]
MFEIEFSQHADKQMRKLPLDVQVRIVHSLERIRVRPYPHVKRLVGCDYFSLRVGEYRVIMDIKESKLIIFVVEVGHRRRVYD